MRRARYPLKQNEEEKGKKEFKRYMQGVNEHLAVVKVFNESFASLHLQGVSDDLKNAIDDYNKNYLMRKY